MNHIHTVFWLALTVSAISIAAFVLTLATWGTQFVRANRPIRKARHQSIPRYYSHLAVAH